MRRGVTSVKRRREVRERAAVQDSEDGQGSAICPKANK
jgi:hypothetical protein